MGRPRADVIMHCHQKELSSPEIHTHHHGLMPSCAATLKPVPSIQLKDLIELKLRLLGYGVVFFSFFLFFWSLG